MTGIEIDLISKAFEEIAPTFAPFFIIGFLAWKWGAFRLEDRSGSAEKANKTLEAILEGVNKMNARLEGIEVHAKEDATQGKEIVDAVRGMDNYLHEIGGHLKAMK